MDKNALGYRMNAALAVITSGLNELGAAQGRAPFTAPPRMAKYDREHNTVFLVESIAEYMRGLSSEGVQPPAPELDYDDYSVSGLRKLAQTRNLDASDGATRSELIDLLGGE